MDRLVFVFLVIACVYGISLRSSINIADSISINDGYQCSCYDNHEGYIYLFNKPINRTQFSAQVKVPMLNVTISDMGMNKFDKFIATACVVVKTTRGNHLFAIGTKLADSNEDKDIAVIVKWNLDTYDLLQYSPLGDDLDADFFHHVVSDPQNNLLMTISDKKLVLLETNCLERVDTKTSFLNQTLLSVFAYNMKVYVGSAASDALNSGHLFEVDYSKQGFEKLFRTASLPSNNLDVQSISIDEDNKNLLVSALFNYYSVKKRLLATLTVRMGILRSVAMNPRGYTLSSGTIVAAPNSKKFYELNIHSLGFAEICEYKIILPGIYDEIGCITASKGTEIHIDLYNHNLYYAYVSNKLKNNEATSYQLQVIAE